MARWYVASSINPADDSSIQQLPNPGAYTDLDDGDFCLLFDGNELHLYQYDSSSSATEAIPAIITPTGNAGNGRWTHKSLATKEANGFDVPLGPDPDSTIAFDDGTRTFTIDPAVDDFKFYVNGVPFTKDSQQSVVINDIEGVHWIYFDVDGVLKSQDPGGTSDDLILYKCLVAHIYWDATNSTAIIVGDERHGSDMNPVTHYHFHETISTLWETGMALGDITADGSGDLDAHAQLSVTDGEMHDEDLEISVEDGNPQTLAGIAQIPVYYMSGASPNWRKITATNFPITTTGTGRAAYNQFTGGSWQLTEVTDGRYCLYHILATDDITNPIIAIPGQNEYTNIVTAQAGANSELNTLILAGLPSQEWIAIGTIIIQTNSSYLNTVKSRIRSVDTGDDYIDWRTARLNGAGSTTGDHESLTGLLGGGAGDHYHLTGTQHTDLTDGGDSDLHQHDTLEYSGSSSVLAHQGGVEVQDTTGTSPRVNFLRNTGVYNGKISVTALGMYLQVGAAFENGIALLKDGAVEIYYDNVKEAETASGIFKVINALQIAAGPVISAVLDEDDMASDSATALATQQSIKAYVRDNAGDPAIPKIDFYQDWLQRTKYQNASVLTCVVSGTLVDSTTMDHNIEEKRYDFTVGEILTTDDLYDSSLSLTNIPECIIDADIVDSGSGTLQVSNDGGSTWVTVTDTSQVIEFTSSGIDLVMKYTAGGTGYINHMGVLYNEDTTYSEPVESTNFKTNIVINGAMDIWQRGTSEVSIGPGTANSILADRFKYQQVAATGEMDQSRSSTVPTAQQAGTKLNYSILLSPSVADAALSATEYLELYTAIEGIDLAKYIGNYVTMSFWARSSKTGTYCVALYSAPGPNSFVHEYTIDAVDTWEYKQFTFYVDPSITFTTTTAAGLYVIFNFGVGSNYQASTTDTWLSGNYHGTSNSVNFFDNTANTLYLTDVRLCAGMKTTDMQHRSIAEELALCQRYFEKSYVLSTVLGTASQLPGLAYGVGRASAATTVDPGPYVKFTTAKRAAPTMAGWAYDGTSGQWQFNGTKAGVTFYAIGETGFGTYSAATLSGLTAGYGYPVQGHWSADAEL